LAEVVDGGHLLKGELVGLVESGEMAEHFMMNILAKVGCLLSVPFLNNANFLGGLH
jgi:hypothetical protein